MLVPYWYRELIGRMETETESQTEITVYDKNCGQSLQQSIGNTIVIVVAYCNSMIETA